MRRKKGRSSKTRSSGAARNVAVEVVAEFLTPEQESRLLVLERKIERAFFEAGQALAEIQSEQLYRGTHISFASYCRERFGFTADSAYLKIAAAEVYENIRVLIPTICRHHNDEIPLPTNENQVRYLAKSSLPPAVQVEAWHQAVEEANGKLPSGRIVKSVVERLTEPATAPIPFAVGEVCKILAKDNPELRGKGGCWGIITEVYDFTCTLATWDNEYQLRSEYLKSLELSEFECKRMEDLGARMSDLHKTGELDEAALWVLNGLARISRAYLSDLEEKLLKVLEKQYRLSG